MTKVPCRNGKKNHVWNEGELSRYCSACWLVQPYPIDNAKRKKTVAPEQHSVPDQRNKNVWIAAQKQGFIQCYWCRELFSEMRPPTEDHIRPVSKGGKRSHGVVFACQTCNSARGSVDFHVYRAAVDEEHERAAAERREYRRPRLRKIDGEWVLGAMTRAELREARG